MFGTVTVNGFILAVLALGAAFWLIRRWRDSGGTRIRHAKSRQQKARPRPRASNKHASEPPVLHDHVATASSGIIVEEVHTGFYGEVALMLERKLADDPKRTDLHAALLDVHRASGRRQAFQQSAKRFACIAGAEQWRRAVELGRDLGVDLTGLRAVDDAATKSAERRARGPARASDFTVDEPVARGVGGEVDRTEELPVQRAANSAPATAAVAAGAGLRHHEYESADAAELERRLADVRGAYGRLRRDLAFLSAYADTVSAELGRPTPLQEAAGLSARVGGARVYLKREDLRAANSERMCNALGQALVARFAERRRLICGSARGDTALAYVTAARMMKLQATIFVPSSGVDEAALAGYAGIDVKRAAPGPHDATDPRRAALTHWLRSGDDTLYVTGLQAGPDPYPTMVSDFQAVVGREALRQLAAIGHAMPDAVVSSVRTGFASIGVCQPFLDQHPVALSMVNLRLRHDAPAPLPMREHTWLAASGRVQFVDVSDAAEEAAASLSLELENLLLSSHNARVVAQAMLMARELPRDAVVVALLAPAADTSMRSGGVSA